MKKKGNKMMPTPKQKLIHNPIPTSLFFVCLRKHTFIKKVSICLQYFHLKTTDSYISERNKDIGSLAITYFTYL